LSEHDIRGAWYESLGAFFIEDAGELVHGQGLPLLFRLEHLVAEVVPAASPLRAVLCRVVIAVYCKNFLLFLWWLV